MKNKCIICDNVFVSPKKKECCSHSCRSRLYKLRNTERELERHRQYYWSQKKINPKGLREINARAVSKKRFGVQDKSLIMKDKCESCGSKKSLLIHHKDNRGRKVGKPNNDPKNLITLCRGCHAEIHLLGRKLKI